MLKSRGHIDEVRTDMITTIENAGIKPNNIFSYMLEQADGAKNIVFLKCNCDNFLPDKRRYTLEVTDAQNVINHFKKMQADYP